MGYFKIQGLSLVLHPVHKKKPHITKVLRSATLLLLSAFFCTPIFAQLNITYDLKKPKAYENRKLKSELTPDKKINPIKKAKENVVAHYNFYFNANNKLQDVISSAKLAFKDTFTQQLSFYNFTLNQTASQKQELDSVIHKANNGILLHDLRNDWVDDLYLLMGQAYFYQEKFDSAYDIFQYINYTFQPRSKDEIGFEKTIGSNLNKSGNVFTVASIEKGISSHTLARNDALIWIIRTLLAQNNDDEAKSLIETLQRDRNFPKRLKDQLLEQKAFFYFKQQQIDSTSFYLIKSIDATANNSEKARRFFLIGQLFEKAGKKEEASNYFDKAIAITTDPVMEAYARINQVALSSNEEDLEKKAEEQVNMLLKMAKREKYLSYQSIIYNAAAEIEISRKNPKKAIELLVMSNLTNTNNPNGRSLNNLSIATLAFNLKNYKLANTYFDSLGIVPMHLQKEIEIKKKVSEQLVSLFIAIEKEDSLLRIARMPEEERNTYLKNLLKKLKKEQGLQEEEEDLAVNNVGSPSGRGQRNNLLDETAGNIFSTAQQKGEWYFNNPSLIAQGKTTFKNKWGTRPNADNWRRLTAINGTRMVAQRGPEGTRRVATQQEIKPALSLESLLAELPISKAKQDAVTLKKTALYIQIGSIFQEKIGDWTSAIEWYEKSLEEGIDTSAQPRVYYNLAFCYEQLKNAQKASYYKNLLVSQYPKHQLTLKSIDPTLALKQEQAKQKAIEEKYNEIYALYLSGKFETAVAEKKKADQEFGPNNWSAQLLYIEALYHIHKRNDKEAISSLTSLTELFPQSPLAEKSRLIIDVVARRASIEAELTAMQVTRVKEDTLPSIEEEVLPKPQIQAPVVVVKTEAPKPTPPAKIQTTDSIKPKTPEVSKTTARYQLNAEDPISVLLVFNNVDQVYVNEAKRALTRYNAERYSSIGLTLENGQIGNSPFIQINIFPNTREAINFVEIIKPLAGREIFPWLQTDKYKFIIISQENLKKTQEDGKIEDYLRFLQLQLPGKF